MSALKSPRLSTPAFGASGGERFPMLACAGLALVLVLQFVVPSSDGVPDAPDLAPRRAPLPGALPNLAFPVVLERPIFAPDRKRPAPTPGVASFEGYRVLGIGIAGADKATVTLRGPDGETERVLFGQDFMGWKLTSVDRAQVVFERDGERRVMELVALPREAARRAARQAHNARAVTPADDEDESESDDEN